jgi:hypothetical protein
MTDQMIKYDVGLAEPPVENRPGRIGRWLQRLSEWLAPPFYTWNTVDEDLALDFACDRYVREPHSWSVMAIDIDAPKSVVWRWLCQQTVAPYSYDWIDNFGRRSPRELTPGAEHMEPGQRLMTIAEILEFEPEEQFTFGICVGRWFWGTAAATQRLVPTSEDRCRLVFRRTAPRGGFLQMLRGMFIARVERLMSRKQLRTFKKLAERTVHP